MILNTEFGLTNFTDCYIRSAAPGLKYTNRTKNLLALILILIWTLYLCLCVKYAIEGITGIQN